MRYLEPIAFIAVGLAFGTAASFHGSALGVVIGSLLIAIGWDEIRQSRIDRSQADERAEGGEG